MKGLSLLFLFCPALSAEVFVSSDFTTAEGFVGGPLAGQENWVGSGFWEVDEASGEVQLTMPWEGVSYGTGFAFQPNDIVDLSIVVQMDFGEDRNQTPFRFGMSSLTDSEGNPVALPFGNSMEGQDVLAIEVVREGFPFLQTEGTSHHSGTVKIRPYAGAEDSESILFSGEEVGIYPHARMAVGTITNGGSGTNETQVLYQVTPLQGVSALAPGEAFRLSRGDESTGDLFVDSTVSEIQSAIEAMPSIGVGNVSVSGDVVSGFEIEFVGALMESDQEEFLVNEPGLTDHKADRLRFDLRVFKVSNLRDFELDLKVTNLDSGLERSLPTLTYTDEEAWVAGERFFGIRGGNLRSTGSLGVQSIRIEHFFGNGDSDGDGFSDSQEVAAGSDRFNPLWTPFKFGYLETDFSGDADGPLNQSEGWMAEAGWQVAGGVAEVSGASGEKAITASASMAWEVGEAMCLRSEFRFTGAADFSTSDPDLLELDLTTETDPALANGLSPFSVQLSSKPINGGMWSWGHSGENLAPVADFYESVGLGGPSDWVSLGLVVEKLETEGQFQVWRILQDLEGVQQELFVAGEMVTDLDLWNTSEFRGLIGFLDGFLEGAIGGVEVRRFDFSTVPAGDLDDDSLSNGEEHARGTDMTEEDSDEDGQNDAFEVSAGTDPLDPTSFVSSPGGIVITECEYLANLSQLRVRFVGQPATVHKLEVSRNLINYFDSDLRLETDENGLGEFLVSSSTVFRKRFFVRVAREF